jgi:UDP-2,3-diacylglucosamine pyrophosphatase LpxH
MTPRAYVVGDLHLGAGDDDPLEDFRDDHIFARFCERIANPDTTLILNGDIVDFAQIGPFDVPETAHLLWTEGESLRKLDTALAAHADFFDGGLKHLLAKGGRVRMLIGNHDLDMCWPAVQARLRARLGDASPDQLAFELGATRFHGVHVEHGHAFTPENCPRDVLNFVHDDDDGAPRLERVWGTDFMLQFYNQLERSYPFADNVKPMINVVWHGVRKGWIGGGTLWRMLVFLKRRGLPWAGIVSSTLGAPAEINPVQLANAFDDPQWRAVLLDRIHDPGFVAELDAGLAALSPSERAIATSAEAVPMAPPVAGGATLGLFRDDRELRGAQTRLAQPGITHVVFGHTHEIVDGALTGQLYNYGTWIPSLNLGDAAVKARVDKDGLTLDVLNDRTLYTSERRVVRIVVGDHDLAEVELALPETA